VADRPGSSASGSFSACRTSTTVVLPQEATSQPAASTTKMTDTMTIASGV
jgi:hypothetical protein